MLPSLFNSEEADVVFRDWWSEVETASLEAALRDTVPILHQGMEDNFMRAAGPDGAAWLPRKDTKPHPLLILYGYLIEAARDTGSAGNITRVGQRELVTGVDASVIEYAPYHEWGTSRMPARPFMYATDEVQSAALQAFSDAAFVILVGV